MPFADLLTAFQFGGTVRSGRRQGEEEQRGPRDQRPQHCHKYPFEHQLPRGAAESPRRLPDRCRAAQTEKGQRPGDDPYRARVKECRDQEYRCGDHDEEGGVERHSRQCGPRKRSDPRPRGAALDKSIGHSCHDENQPRQRCQAERDGPLDRGELVVEEKEKERKHGQQAREQTRGHSPAECPAGDPPP